MKVSVRVLVLVKTKVEERLGHWVVVVVVVAQTTNNTKKSKKEQVVKAKETKGKVRGGSGSGACSYLKRMKTNNAWISHELKTKEERRNGLMDVQLNQLDHHLTSSA